MRDATIARNYAEVLVILRAHFNAATRIALSFS